MNPPRIYVITGCPPGCHSIGSIFLRDVLTCLPPDCVTVGVLGPVTGHPRSLDCLPALNKKVFSIRVPAFYRGPADVMARLRTTAAWYRILMWHGRQLSKAVVAHAQASGCERLFINLDHPLVWLVGEAASRRLGVPVSVHLLDPPHFQLWWRTGGADRRVRALLQACLWRLLSSAAGVGVTSWALVSEVRSHVSVKPEVILHGFDRAQWRAPRGHLASPGCLRLAFAGNLYGSDAWDSLLSALAASHWQTSNLATSLSVIGSVSLGPYARPVSIHVLGRRTTEATLESLSACDVAYLPYPFGREHRQTAAQAFPSKMSSYLAAGLPVLFHGPSESGAAAFVHDHGIGVACCALEAEAVTAALCRFADPSLYAAMCSRITPTLEHELGGHVYRRRFAQILGVPLDLLSTPPDPVCLRCAVAHTRDQPSPECPSCDFSLDDAFAGRGIAPHG
jgi:hypothetical protein